MPTIAPESFPRLLADIGGTNARSPCKRQTDGLEVKPGPAVADHHHERLASIVAPHNKHLPYLHHGFTGMVRCLRRSAQWLG